MDAIGTLQKLVREQWCDIATLRTHVERESGAKMVAAAPQTYRLLVNGNVATVNADGSYMWRGKP